MGAAARRPRGGTRSRRRVPRHRTQEPSVTLGHTRVAGPGSQPCARLGDSAGALELLHDAAVICRHDGLLPQSAATLGFSLNLLCHIGQLDVAATLIGGLDRGALASAASFPGTADSRARTLARIHDTLGHDKTDQLVEQGAAMTYDELIAYAIAALGRRGLEALAV